MTRFVYRVPIMMALDWGLRDVSLSQALVDEASDAAHEAHGQAFRDADAEGEASYDIKQDDDKFMVVVSWGDDLPHSDSMTFEQLCQAAAWQMVWACQGTFELDDEQQGLVEEALTQALVLRPASLEVLIDNNVLPHSLIETWDQEAREGEA